MENGGGGGVRPRGGGGPRPRRSDGTSVGGLHAPTHRIGAPRKARGCSSDGMTKLQSHPPPPCRGQGFDSPQLRRLRRCRLGWQAAKDRCRFPSNSRRTSCDAERTGGAPELLPSHRGDRLGSGLRGRELSSGGPNRRRRPSNGAPCWGVNAPGGAIRGTREETGIAVGFDPAPDAGRPCRHCEAASRRRALASLLGANGLAVDAEALTPFARWCPNFRETRRFDTLFFLAAAPADAAEPSVSAHEAVRAFWASAAEILAEVDAGRGHVIFPTRRNLERLARFGSIAEARADAARHPVEKITPWVEQRGGAPRLHPRRDRLSVTRSRWNGAGAEHAQSPAPPGTALILPGRVRRLLLYAMRRRHPRTCPGPSSTSAARSRFHRPQPRFGGLR